jgi:hypothetical protein
LESAGGGTERSVSSCVSRVRKLTRVNNEIDAVLAPEIAAADLERSRAA